MHCSARAGSQLCALAAGAALLLSACSEPPAAEEPTGDELDRAWRIAVGEDPLDRTVAHIYSLALNSRDQPTVVVEAEQPTHEAAARLASSPAEDEEGTDGPPEDPQEEHGGSDAGEYEIVLARTMPLAETLDPEGYSELTTPEEGSGAAPAAAAEGLTDLIAEALEGDGDPQAHMLTPGAAVLSTSAMTTTASAAALELDEEEPEGMAGLEEHCQDLVFAHREGLPQLQEALDEIYGCEPEGMSEAEEDTLIEQLITAQADVVLVTSSHPGAQENALVELEDTGRAFPRDQYVPVITAGLAEDSYEVADEISEALDGDSIAMLRRLLHGEDGLAPEEAAQYWMVEEDFIAEPDTWG
ncbi:glycine betaine ABC transporter substrate-binding protein [Nesterenkonia populi]